MTSPANNTEYQSTYWGLNLWPQEVSCVGTWDVFNSCSVISNRTTGVRYWSMASFDMYTSEMSTAKKSLTWRAFMPCLILDLDGSEFLRSLNARTQPPMSHTIVVVLAEFPRLHCSQRRPGKRPYVCVVNPYSFWWIRVSDRILCLFEVTV
jgi:hypothetical protein